MRVVGDVMVLNVHDVSFNDKEYDASSYDVDSNGAMN
ncbi:conserved hypothetical protein [Arthrobacter sp. 9V]|nr:conserved hypothetical protein [Arthrobacter sp. 9V]